MKLALDVSAVPVKVAGAGRYVVELARRLPGCEVDTTLVTRRSDTERWRELSPGARVAGIVPDARGPRLIHEAWALGRSSVARGADVWHGPHYTMPHRGSTPTVVTIHDLTFFTNPEWHERAKVAFFRRAITYAARHAQVLITVSETTARALDDVVAAHAPVVVAPLGVDLAAFTPAQGGDEARWREHALPEDTRYVFYVGTLEPRKGLDVLLAAFRSVAARDGVVELWLAGQAGWGQGPLEQELASHPFRSRIRRLGYVDQGLLPALYRHAAVVAYPSRGEGFGLPVLEALACGAPTVTTQGTVMAEVAGDAASLVPVGDADALAEALSGALALGGPEREAIGQRARARALSFTWEACVERHQEAYERAARGG